MIPNATTFPLLPIASDGSCGCGKRECTDAGKHPAIAWGAKSLGAGTKVEIPEGYGVGLATGERSGVIVIDLDLKDGKDGLAALQCLGEVPETLAVRTPTGGFHLYFRHPGFKVSNSAGVLGPGIDVRGDGGYVVLPPSPHRKGGVYEWIDPSAPIAPAPAWLLELLKHGPKRARTIKRETLERIAKTWRRAKAPARQDLGEALERVTKGEAFAGPGERDETIFRLARGLAELLPEADPVSIAEHFGPSLDLMSREAPDCPGVEVVIEKLSRALGENDTGPWASKLAASENGAPKACLGNAVLVLEHHRAFEGVLAYDERRQREVFLKPPPWGGPVPRDMQDEDATRCAVWLTEGQRMTVGADVCRKAMDAVARAHPFDLVREGLERLAWDGVPRLDRWLIEYAGAEDTEYTRAVSAKFALSLVARALDPGCKVDTMIILEGKQGIGKSSLLRVLVGPENFADDLPDIEAKDAKDYLQGPWLIEIKELTGFDRKEAAARKAFLDQRTDRYRAAYAAKTLDLPRRCVFAGTTNESEYLRDQTGNRRYWPVAVTRCDHARLGTVRDLVLAEAVHRYRMGEPWWLTEAEEEAASAEQDARQEVDPWEPLITAALETGVRRKAWQRIGGAVEELWGIPPKASEVAVSEVLEFVIGIPAAGRTRGHEMRIASILKKGGWIRRYTRRGGWRYSQP